YAGQRAAAEQVVAEITARGGQALAVRADVSRAGDVRALFDAAERAFGGVDVVVNNAGVMALAPIADMDEATFDRVITTNLKGTFLVLAEAARRVRGGGRLINFSSSVIGLQLPTYAAY